MFNGGAHLLVSGRWPDFSENLSVSPIRIQPLFFHFTALFAEQMHYTTGIASQTFIFAYKYFSPIHGEKSLWSHMQPDRVGCPRHKLSKKYKC